MAPARRSYADVLFGDAVGIVQPDADEQADADLDTDDDDADDDGEADDDADDDAEPDDEADAGTAPTRRSDADVLFGDAQGVRPATSHQDRQSGETPSVVAGHYDLRLPDGTPFDASDLAAFVESAKCGGLTNEQAKAALRDLSNEVADRIATYRSELESDPEVGGAHREAAQQLVQQTLDRFLPRDEEDGIRFRTALRRGGYRDWKPLVKLLTRLAKALPEERPRPGRARG
jgi:hypothetical protein